MPKLSQYNGKEWIEISGKIGPRGPLGPRGLRGKMPVKGIDYFDGIDGRPGKDGRTPIKGIDYFDGDKGDKGDVPKHKWKGYKLSFELPNGKWGKAKDLTPIIQRINTVKNVGGGGAYSFTQLNETPSTLVGSAGKVLAVNATETGIEYSEAGTGDMTKAVYDPTSKEADAFDMDNMTQGSTNFFVSSADVTKLSNLSGTNTGDNAVNTLYSSLTQYTDELAQDAVGGILTNTGNVQFTYDDTTPKITATVDLSGKASLALDNLASVAVNTSLISDTDSTDDLGSVTKQWANVHTDRLVSTISDLVIENDLQDGDISFKVNDGGVDKTVMTLDGASGNVGIGTTAPTAPLHVYTNTNAWGIVTGNATNGNNMRLSGTAGASVDYSLIQTYSGGTVTGGALVFQRDGGNVGIGTTSPGAKLEVVGGSSGNYIISRFRNSYFSSSSGLTIAGTDAGIFSFDAEGGGQFAFKSSGNEKVRITTTGNVGIGTTSPGSKLHVAGSQTVLRTATATNYTVLTTDYLVAVTDTSAARTITLPTVASALVGKIYIIKDESGGAGTNNITIDGNGAETIDGAATYALTSGYSSVMLYCNGTGWNTLFAPGWTI